MTLTSGSAGLDHNQIWTPGVEAFHKISFDLKDGYHCSVMTENNLQLRFVFIHMCFFMFFSISHSLSIKESPIQMFHALYIQLFKFSQNWDAEEPDWSLTESGSQGNSSCCRWSLTQRRWVSSWAQSAGCCTQETAARRGQGRASTFDLSAFPGWSGRTWVGSVEQARCWAAGWCGWRTCHRGSQKTVSSWTLVLETPRQLLHHRDSQPKLSWHRRGTRSRILKERAQ